MPFGFPPERAFSFTGIPTSASISTLIQLESSLQYSLAALFSVQARSIFAAEGCSKFEGCSAAGHQGKFAPIYLLDKNPNPQKCGFSVG
jgi:hypothetical protein